MNDNIKCTFKKPGQLCGYMKVKTNGDIDEICTLSAGKCDYQGFEQPLPSKCTWSNSEGVTDDNSNTYWETSCDSYFFLSEGTPDSSGLSYCCFCGKPIEQLVEE